MLITGRSSARFSTLAKDYVHRRMSLVCATIESRTLLSASDFCKCKLVIFSRQLTDDEFYDLCTYLGWTSFDCDDELSALRYNENIYSRNFVCTLDVSHLADDYRIGSVGMATMRRMIRAAFDHTLPACAVENRPALRVHFRNANGLLRFDTDTGRSRCCYAASVGTNLVVNKWNCRRLQNSIYQYYVHSLI